MTAALDIEVTRKCNLRCDYCFVGWSRDWTTSMSPQVARQIVEEGTGLFSQLHFTGGEPFTYPEIFELVETGLKLDYPEILINSNGTFFTPAIARRLAEYGPRIHISASLDGPEDIHDAVRGSGRFQETTKGIDRLLEAGVRVTIMSVVTPQVLGVLPSYVTGIYERLPGIVGITLFPVGVGTPGSQKPGVPLRALQPKELRELALAVSLLYRSGRNVGVAAYPIINPLLSAFGYPREKQYQCMAGRGRVCVHSDLTVSTCHPVKEPVYGKWSPGLFPRLHENPAHLRLANRDFDDCRSCALKEECGHCRAFVMADGLSLYENDRVCREALPHLAGPKHPLPVSGLI